ncbi:hypothetical protein [Nitrospirillum amazonense]|uniref:hypothetical protein n=1 Tax=Nitrospirillum amazonense TaxID=28077 RepID=UPI0011A26464|nr:hypothetical protein [Nitrospirillum amazonense]
MDANKFLTLLQKATFDCPPTGLGATWTTSMDRIFDHIAKAAKMRIRSRRIGGEIGRIDYAFVKSESSHPRIEIAVEHENYWSSKESLRDFHKLCTVLSPLRVMFCYRSRESQVQSSIQDLINHYEAETHHEIPNSQFLILGGWRQDDLPNFRWHVHLKDPQRGENWDSIPYPPRRNS